MLALVERYLDRIRKAQTDADVIKILGDVSASLGFRSAYLIEYVTDLKAALHILDSNPDREGWWEEFFSSGLRAGTAEEIGATLAKGGVQFSASVVLSRTIRC